MNIKKILFIILLIIVSIFLLVLLTGQITFFNKKSKSYLTNEIISKPISNTFLPIKGSYCLGVGEDTPLNFTYIYSSNKKDLFNEIYSINLSNEDSISIESFEVNGNAKIGKYRAKTLGLHIIGLSKGKTEVSELTIQTKNGFKKYDVGALEISVIEDTSDKPLELGNFYPIIRDEKNNYMYSLQNNGSNKILVNKFDTELNGEQVINIKPIVIDPNEQKEDEVPIKVDFQNSPYAVTVVRPSIHYSDGNEQRILLPPPTWYGLTGITEDQIEKTIEYNN
ncbi:hypothetical protein [Bacillus sp. AFS029533]|uniref:hypothetical protein n=1 Tax=Bacillus sp. AFS029533 TaxID=2033494 RepID=UPI000BFB5DA6|nr:hypothetical protein [Bacillus sp. AFS029533]PGZ92225.1 hypothetical protein COE53_12740 [Bacillus sp. AFS029533]